MKVNGEVIPPPKWYYAGKQRMRHTVLIAEKDVTLVGVAEFCDLLVDGVLGTLLFADVPFWSGKKKLLLSVLVQAIAWGLLAACHETGLTLFSLF